MQIQREQETMYVLKYDYPIDYAFFFNFSTISNHVLNHPASYRFLHKSNSNIVRHRKGAWLSSSSTAILGICTDSSHSHFVLAIYLHGKMLEEHLISKLHFSWPQSSCDSECSIRGSRVVFASYKDSMGQIQKFAMRFMRSSDSNSFIDALKEITQHMKTIGSPSSTFEAGAKLETECTTLDVVHQSRAAVELDSLYPAVSDTQLQLHSTSGATHITLASNGFSSTLGNLPSSVTAFLPDCSPVSQEGGTDQMKVPSEYHTISFLMKHMPASSFYVMLSEMEKFISDTGGDLGLQIM